MLFFIFLFVLPCLYLISLCLWHGVSLYFVTYHSGVPDLKYLRQPRKNGKIDGTAVICGGSIAGLLTAKICETHFKRVIIVEPEAWLATEEGRRLHGWGQTQHRSRVMQYKSLQGNQSTILAGLTALFPDFKEEVVKSGMRIGPGDFKTTFAGTAVKLPTIYLGQDLPNTIFTSRQGLETLIRRLVLGKTSSIEHIIGTVTGLSVDPNDPSRISHVTVRTDDGPIEVEAALVADCTGVTRAGIKWLERLGFGKTSEGGIPLKSLKVSLDQKLQYTSIMVSLSPELHQRLPIPGGLERAQAVYTFLEDQPTLGRRFFVITKPEGDQILLFGGQSSDSSPGLKTIEDMIDYAKSMVTFRDPIPHWVFEIMELLKEHEEVKSVSQIRVPGTSYIRYHMASQLPSNFVAVGDSVMSVNPTFAQGCSKAFLGALSLNNALRKVKASTLPPNFSRKFFAEHCAKTDHYWQTTKLMDYGIPTTIPIPGEDLSSGASIRFYIRRMQILAITDDHAALAMYNSALGLGTPFDPFHPNLMVKILWDVIRRPAL